MKPKTYFTFILIVFLNNTKAIINVPQNLANSNNVTVEKIKESITSRVPSLASFAFIENKGQIRGYDGLPHPEVKFSFRQGGVQIFLLEKGIAYQFNKVLYPEGYLELMHDKLTAQDMEKMLNMKKRIRIETYRMDMTLVGANQFARISKEGMSYDYSNFYTHNALDVHGFCKITYHEIYPGIDWVIYSKNNQIKYDFIVKPGANPSLIKMEFTHQEDLSLNSDGSFTLRNRMGFITENRPESFQEGKNIATKFVLKDNRISFEIGNYARDKKLIIDPALVWGSYYGGTIDDFGISSCSDAAGNVYLAGYTASPSNIAFGGFQTSQGGGYDAFIVKFNNAGSAQWSTYYGGSNDDFARSCACDASGNVFLAGITQSTANIGSGGHQNSFGGGNWDAFLIMFNNSGLLQWGTYYGGTGFDDGVSCATDALGNIYLTGNTGSTTGIAIGGHQNTFGGGIYDAFLVKFNNIGLRLWGTYYGNAGSDHGAFCCIDGLSNVYMAGSTQSSVSIASNGHQNTLVGSWDSYLVKFNNSGTRLWATYYGGTGGETGSSCTIDASDNVYLAGLTESSNNIAINGYQNTGGGIGNWDAFLVKFNNSGIRQWGTYYGTNGYEDASSCVTDSSGNVYLLGNTSTTNNIAYSGYQNTYGGGAMDAYFVRFTSSGLRQWSSYYGSFDSDYGTTCCVDYSGNIYLGGYTQSTVNIANTSGFQNTYGGGSFDAFLVKFCENPHQPSFISGNTLICSGKTQTYTVINDSSATSYSWTFPGTWPSASVTNSLIYVSGNSGVISVVAQNSCAASVAQTLSITVLALPTISVNSGSICNGQSFTISPIGANSFTVSGGSSIVNPHTNSTYSVSGTNSAGCVSTLSAVSNVTVYSLPLVAIIGTTSTMCKGESLTLSVSGASTYSWNNSFTGTSLVTTPSTTATYYVVGTDTNGCENSASVTQTVDACLRTNNILTNNQLILYPNPNHGLFFVETVQEINFNIFNSLGQYILHQKLTEGLNKIDLRGQTNGIYFIRVQNSEISFKVIIE